MLRHNSCKILSLEHVNKLNESMFNFSSTAKSQAHGDPRGKCKLFLLQALLFQHKSQKTNWNNNVIHFCSCEVKLIKVKVCVSFKCLFCYFKSSTEAIEAIQSKWPHAMKQHFRERCFSYSKSFYIQNAIIQLPSVMFVICK